MVPALIILALAFGALSVVRLVGAERVTLARYAGHIAVTLVCLLIAVRGGPWGAALGALAAGALWAWTLYRPPALAQAHREPMTDEDARIILGVGPDASAAEIKAAFRAKMQRAHPDRGGAAEDAARLIAARDRLLRS